VAFPDGSTLEGAIVTFQSVPDGNQDGAKSISAVGKVSADGTCHMMTYKPGDGAIAGKHRVAVAPPPMSHGPHDPRDPTRTTPLVHSRFRRPDTSGLEVTVTPQGPNEFDIRIERS